MWNEVMNVWLGLSIMGAIAFTVWWLLEGIFKGDWNHGDYLLALLMAALWPILLPVAIYAMITGAIQERNDTKKIEAWRKERLQSDEQPNPNS